MLTLLAGLVLSSGAWAQGDAQSFDSCPSDMIAVTGNYCPEVVQNCEKWMDTGRFMYYRCAKYAQPSICKSKKRIPLHFCIDKYEYTAPGEKLPMVNLSWTTSAPICNQQGKRLCMESEWQFACEGEDMRPYPYGNGFVRDASACNIDRDHLGKPNSGLNDLREPFDARPNCVSQFGVVNMSGNVEEWATIDHPGPDGNRAAMKGAWWLPGKNNCRARTVEHGEKYAGKQVGVRCCRDLNPPPASSEN